MKGELIRTKAQCTLSSQWIHTTSSTSSRSNAQVRPDYFESSKTWATSISRPANAERLISLVAHLTLIAKPAINWKILNEFSRMRESRQRRYRVQSVRLTSSVNVRCHECHESKAIIGDEDWWQRESEDKSWRQVCSRWLISGDIKSWN